MNRGTAMGVGTTTAGFLTVAGLLMPIALVGSGSALAQSAPSDTRAAPTLAQANPPSDTSAQSRKRRPRVRIYREDERGVYPSHNPGPGAVRECAAHYVQEFRSSGTVIVPRMNCYWRHG